MTPATLARTRSRSSSMSIINWSSMRSGFSKRSHRLVRLDLITREKFVNHFMRASQKKTMIGLIPLLKSLGKHSNPGHQGRAMALAHGTQGDDRSAQGQ